MTDPERVGTNERGVSPLVLTCPIRPSAMPPGRFAAGVVTLLAVFTFVVDREPARAGIDPVHLFIDRSPADNTAAVTRAS